MKAEIAARIEAEKDTDHVVVLDTPLLTVTEGHKFAAVLVVDLPVELAVERLVGLRGMDEQDARARIAKQMTREERLAKADQVIDNSGDLAALTSRVDEVWAWLEALTEPPASPPAVRWLTVFVDRPAATFDAAAAFWLAATGATASPRRGEHGEFFTAVPPDGDAYVRLQRIDDGPGGLHLDVHVEDLRAAADHAVSLGATEVADLGDVVVMSSPAGLAWCVVAHDGESAVPAPTTLPDGSRTRFTQVCVDVAPDRFDAECAFWSDLTGWAPRARARAEYRGLEVPTGQPLRLLFQRQDEASPDHDVERAPGHLLLGRRCRRRAPSPARRRAGGRVPVVDRDPRPVGCRVLPDPARPRLTADAPIGEPSRLTSARCAHSSRAVNGLAIGALIGAGVLAATNWWALVTHRPHVERLAKPGATALLVVVAATAGSPEPVVRVALVVAVLFGLVGDIALLGDSEARFMAGLGAFAVGHAAYVVAALGVGWSWRHALIAVPFMAVLLGWRFLPETAPGARRAGGTVLFVAVLGYAVIISAMVVTAAGQPVGPCHRRRDGVRRQ